MASISEIIFSGFVSTVVNDIVDISKYKIKRAVKNRNAKHQSIESQIYNVIVNMLNKIISNRYEDNQDNIYDAAEVLLKSFKKNDENELESIKLCLRVLGSPANENECLKFKVSLYEELSKDEYSELFRTILLLLLDQKNGYDYAIYMQLSQKLDEVILIVNQKRDSDKNDSKIQRVRSRTQEYADKWNQNMFLNNFDKRDEKAGTNVKLRDVYLENHLPHYIWGSNTNVACDLKQLMNECVHRGGSTHAQMLLVLGQPGIGKSTLITWVTVNLIHNINEILVYQFASDLKDIQWDNANNIPDKILETLNLTYDDLDGKTLILDGFDEVNAGNYRISILNQIYRKFMGNDSWHRFSVIITCRENYIQDLSILECKYIFLQTWDEKQIQSFCKVFEEKANCIVTEDTKVNILKNSSILGIPLILYMVLALNIDIKKNGSIVDVYDRIFSLQGGIYDRCIDNKRFANIHRISDVKEQIHQISRDIAIWIFENNSIEASIPQREYQKICKNVMEEQQKNEEIEQQKNEEIEQQKNKEIEQDFLIGNFFKLVKHCEGVETEELYFVHRSIYEYFVVETIFVSVYKKKDMSQEEMACVFGRLLKKGKLSPNMLNYLRQKIEKNRLNNIQGIVNKVFDKMLEEGMTYYTGEYYKNSIDCETNVFANMLEILHLFENNFRNYTLLNTNYIKCNMNNKLNLKKVNLKETDLNGVDLEEANLTGADLTDAKLIGANLMGGILERSKLSGSDLMGANLEKANLKEADLVGTNLEKANLKEADLRGADLRCADLGRANLRGADLRGADLENIKLHNAILINTIFDANQVEYLGGEFDLRGAKEYVDENIQYYI